MDQDQTWHDDLVPECDVRLGDDGRWHGWHRLSGETFEAGSFRGLELAAIAKRILHLWGRRS